MLNFASTAALKWSSSNVTEHTGSIRDVAAHVPAFRRASSRNRRRDWILRQPLPTDVDRTVVPLGDVSKRYTLVPHSAVIDAVVKALEDSDIAPAAVHADLALTEYGERMALSVELPDAYSFDPGDGYPMALRFECLNSVDGSMRLRALVGWFRLVCCNGLIVGTTRRDVSFRHAGEVAASELGGALQDGIEAARREKNALRAWRRIQITPDALAPWIDDAVKAAWGFKAAARAWHIIRTGTDAKIAGSYKNSRPSSVRVTDLNSVPGAPAEARSLFDVSQALAWLARQRTDLREQLRWRDQIPGLMGNLRL